MDSQPELANEEGNSNSEMKTHQTGGGTSFLELTGTCTNGTAFLALQGCAKDSLWYFNYIQIWCYIY